MDRHRLLTRLRGKAIRLRILADRLGRREAGLCLCLVLCFAFFAAARLKLIRSVGSKRVAFDDSTARRGCDKPSEMHKEAIEGLGGLHEDVEIGEVGPSLCRR